MNRRLLLPLLAGAVAVIGTMAWLSWPPAIALVESQIQLGTVPVGGVVRKKLQFANHGWSPLIIEKMHMSCACTEVQLDKSQLAYGECATLTIVVKARGLVGPRVDEVVLMTNNPARPQVALSLRYHVGVESVVFEPAFVDLGNLERSQLPHGVSLRICKAEPWTKDEIESLRAETSSAGIQVKFAATDDAYIVRLEVLALPELESGQCHFKIKVQGVGINHTLNGHGCVRGRIHVAPPSVILGPLGAEADKLDITLLVQESKGDATIVVHGVTVSASLSELIRAEPRTDSQNKVQMTLTRPVSGRVWKVARVEGHIRIEASTSDGEREAVNVPIIVFLD